MHRNDITAAVAAANPVASTELTRSEQIRSEAVLERVLSSSTPDTRRTSTGRKMLRVAGIGAATTVGLVGVAWATDVTPQSIDAASRVIQAADAGSVTYSDAPTDSNAGALDDIARTARVSQEHGFTDSTVEATYTECRDSWHSSAAEPKVQCIARTDWTMSDGSVRLEQKALSGAAEGFLVEHPPVSANHFSQYEPAAVGRAVTLGPTPADTAAALAGAEAEGWALVEAYVSQYPQGIGLSSGNRAAFAELLATLNPTDYGTATDSLGRVGNAFSVTRQFSGYQEEYRLTLDPATGELLAMENVLHGPWFVLGSRDHVTSSTTYLSVVDVPDPLPCSDVPTCVTVPIG